VLDWEGAPGQGATDFMSRIRHSSAVLAVGAFVALAGVLAAVFYGCGGSMGVDPRGRDVVVTVPPVVVALSPEQRQQRAEA